METAVVYCEDVNSLLKIDPKHIKRRILVISDRYYVKEYVEDKTEYEFILLGGYDKEGYKKTIDILKLFNSLIDEAGLTNNSYLYHFTYRTEETFAHRLIKYLFYLSEFGKVVQENNASIFCFFSDNSSAFYAAKTIAGNKKIKLIVGNKKTARRNSTPWKLLGSFVHIFAKILSVYTIRLSGISHGVEKKYDLGIIHSSDAGKNINRTIQAVNSNYRSFDYCLLCCGSHEASKKFAEADINVVEIERYYKIADSFRLFFGYLSDIRKIVAAINHCDRLEYCGYDISKEVREQGINEVRYSGFDNVVYESAIRNLLTNIHFNLFRAYGDSTFVMNEIFSNVYNDINGRRPDMYYEEIEIVVHEYRCNYEPKANLINYRLFSRDDFHYGYLRSIGWTGQALYVPFGIYPGVSGENKVFVKTNKKNTYAWLPSAPASDYYYPSSFFEDNRKIMNLFSGTDRELLVKYHPKMDKGMIDKACFAYTNDENIHVYDLSESAETIISSADIVITTPSRVVMDVAVKNKPVVCVISNEYDLRNPDKKFSKYFLCIDPNNNDDMIKLESFLFDNDRVDKWSELVRAQNDFFNYYNDVEYSSVADAVASILKNIKRKNE